MKKMIYLCLCAMALAACTGAATPAPKPTDTSAPAPTNTPMPISTELPIINRSAPGQPGATNPSILIEMTAAALAPTAADKDWLEGSVFIQDKKITATGGKAALELRGNLPTPCNMLRMVMDKPTANNLVNIRVYTVSDPRRMCVQALAPLNARIDLGALPTGAYTFVLNGEEIGKIVL